MNKVAKHHTEDFIAYWVDGIYLKNEWIAYSIVDEFENLLFQTHLQYYKR